MKQAGGLWPYRTREEKNDWQWGRDRSKQCLFFFFFLRFILRFEKKPRSGPPTANCLQCCSKFVQPQFDFGSWRGNRIVDDFSFGCTAGGLSASVLSPLLPFFPRHPGYFLPPSSSLLWNEMCACRQHELVGDVIAGKKENNRGKKACREGGQRLAEVSHRRMQKNSPRR